MATFHSNSKYMRVLVISALVCGIFGTSEPVDNPCSSEWSWYEEKCYKMLEDTMPWEQASYTCDSLGGNLVTVPDERTKRHLVKNMMKKASMDAIWIGLNDHMKEGDYVWEDSSVPVSALYTDWAEGRPTNKYPNDETCVYLKDTPGNGWFDDQCNTRRGAVCEKRSEDIDTPSDDLSSRPAAILAPPRLPQAEQEMCSEGFTPFRGACYKVFDALAGARDYFVDVCVRRQNVDKSRRLVIDNIGKNNFVHKLLAKTMRDDGHAWLELVGQVDEDGQLLFFWPDSNELIGFTNWEEGQPKMPRFKTIGEPRVCVKMVENGKWRVAECSSHLTRTVCKQLMETKAVDKNNMVGKHQHGKPGTDCEEDACALRTPQKLRPSPCPRSWIRIRDMCYWPFANPLAQATWHEANAICGSSGRNGSLARVQRRGLRRRLRNEMAKAFQITDSLDMWIGLIDESNSGEFKWVDKRPSESMTFDRNATEKGQACMAWNLQGRGKKEWLPLNCTKLMYFICQIPIDSTPNKTSEKPPRIIKPQENDSKDRFPTKNFKLSGLKRVIETIFVTNNSLTHITEEKIWSPSN